MNLMCKLLCYGLVFLIFTHSFAGMAILTWFKINESYIAAYLCENLNQPEKGCNGKCVLDKNLKAIDAHFTPLHESLQRLLDMDVTIFACPGCMRAHGITPEELREGIQVAQKDKFFNFTQGNIVSLSY